MAIAAYHVGGGGTPTAMFAAGGSFGSSDKTQTEEYNGTGWEAGGSIGTGRGEMGSAGTLTAGLIYGGYRVTPPASTKDLTEEYDGSSWTAGGALNTARYSQGGFGTQTAAVYGSGFNPSGLVTDTEEYNGTSWSEGNNPAQARYDVGTGGTLTAGIIFGGGGVTAPVVYANTELYDGTNWTAGPAMNTARQALGGSGTQTAVIGFGEGTSFQNVMGDFNPVFDPLTGQVVSGGSETFDASVPGIFQTDIFPVESDSDRLKDDGDDEVAEEVAEEEVAGEVDTGYTIVDGKYICNTPGYVHDPKIDACVLASDLVDDKTKPVVLQSFDDVLKRVVRPSPGVAPISDNIRTMQDGGMVNTNKMVDEFLVALGA